MKTLLLSKLHTFLGSYFLIIIKYVTSSKLKFLFLHAVLLEMYSTDYEYCNSFSDEAYSKYNWNLKTILLHKIQEIKYIAVSKYYYGHNCKFKFSDKDLIFKPSQADKLDTWESL